jgi:hypothetical protein
MRLAIGAPTRDMVPASFAVDLAELYAFSKQYGDFEDVTINFVASSYIHVGAERFLAQAIRDWRATHVLWLETDMAFPKDAAIRLAKHKRPIVSTNPVMRHFPIRFTAIRNGKRIATTSESSGLEEVDACGLAVMLMRTDVVQNLEKPWFRHEWNEGEHDIGHDAVFCYRLKQLGHRIFIDHDLSKEIGHVGNYTYRPSSDSAFSVQRGAIRSTA